MITAAQDAIAVTGMAGRFPGAGDVAGFWANTVSAGQHITRNLRDDGTLAWARGELTGIAEFDHEFFAISGREAVTIDPQHRIFLECAWEALEDAGRLGRSRIPRTGVFASANHSGYRDTLAAAFPHLAGMEAETGTLQAGPARDRRYGANGVLVVTGGHPPRLPVPGRVRGRPGTRRRGVRRPPPIRGLAV